MSDLFSQSLDAKVSESCFSSWCVGRRVCGFIFHSSPRLLLDYLDNSDPKKWVYLSIHGQWLYCENADSSWPINFPIDSTSDQKLGVLSFMLRDAVIDGVCIKPGSCDIKISFRGAGVMFISGRDTDYPSWELVFPDGCMSNSSESFIVNW